MSSRGDVDLVIDVSNVVRSRLAGRGRWGSWEALERVVDGLLEHHDQPYAVFVADRALLDPKSERPLDPLGRLRFAELERWGERAPIPVVHTPAYADPIIVELARETGAAIVSNDGFAGFRRRQPWLDGAIRWRFDRAGGRARVWREPFALVDSYRVSKEEERDDLRAAGVFSSDLERRRLAFVYECVNQACEPGQTPGGLRRLPAMRGRRLVCPYCGKPVEASGEREEFVVLKLQRPGGAGRRTFVLEDRHELVLGRELAAPIDLTELLSAQDASRLSRNHLRARFDHRTGRDGTRQRIVTVVDCGSTNGSLLCRRTGPGRYASELMAVGLEYSLNANDKVVLAGRLELAISGKRQHPPPRGEDRAADRGEDDTGV